MPQKISFTCWGRAGREISILVKLSMYSRYYSQLISRLYLLSFNIFFSNIPCQRLSRKYSLQEKKESWSDDPAFPEYYFLYITKRQLCKINRDTCLHQHQEKDSRIHRKLKKKKKISLRMCVSVLMCESFSMGINGEKKQP